MKKIFLTSGVLLLLGLFITSQAQTQSGGFYFHKGNADFTLNTNEGKRNVEIEVAFDKPYDTKPSVIIAVTLIDAVRNTKMRYSVAPKSISRDGFIIRAEVWGDTQLNAIGGYWIAHTTD
jgi:hypothetical protein